MVMNTIAVDDEHWMLVRFRRECSEIDSINLLDCFTDPLKALEFARTNEINLAFLDISMPKMNGLELSDKLRELYPDIIIIYISAYEQYMVDAFKNRAADYFLIKPYTNEDLKAVIDRAQLLSARQKKRIYIETFGNFSVFIDGKPLSFSSPVAKEIFALLVDKRGTILTNKEAFNTIWEHLPYDHQNTTRYRKGLVKLRNTLANAGISDILNSTKYEHCLDISKFDCDYYQFLNGDKDAIKKFHGEYMLEYSWAEETTAYLTSHTHYLNSIDP